MSPVSDELLRLAKELGVDPKDYGPLGENDPEFSSDVYLRQGLAELDKKPLKVWQPPSERSVCRSKR